MSVSVCHSRSVSNANTLDLDCGDGENSHSIDNILRGEHAVNEIELESDEEEEEYEEEDEEDQPSEEQNQDQLQQTNSSSEEEEQNTVTVEMQQNSVKIQEVSVEQLEKYADFDSLGQSQGSMQSFDDE